MRPVSEKRLYQVLITFLEGMLFLQLGYFVLNFLLTITADLDSCIHNVHWAFILSVPVITEAMFAFSVICGNDENVNIVSMAILVT